MAQQLSFEEAFHATGDTELDAEFWNRFVRELAARFRGLEGIKVAWEEVSRQGIGVALDRINETLAPAAERIRNLTELGFLVATSETPATLGVGQVVSLVVTEGPARDLFTPSPFLMLGRSLSAEDYAVAKLRFYDPAEGVLEVEVLSFVGAPGPHEDWSIGAIAGSTLAQLLALEQGLAAQAATLADRQTVQTARGDTLAARQTATEARDEALAHRNTAKDHRDAAALSKGAAEQAASNAAASAASVDGPAIAGRLTALEAVASGGRATATMLRAGTDNSRHLTSKVVADALKYVPLSAAAATVPWNMAGGDMLSLDLPANRTLGEPTNVREGATGLIKVKGNGYALAFAPCFTFGALGLPALSGGAIEDLLTFAVLDATPGAIRIRLTFLQGA